VSSFDFLSTLLVDEFGVSSDEIRPDATVADLGLDSLSTAELVEELEQEYKIELSSEQAMFDTLGEAAAIVDELIEARGV
jgi:acyl carrier protein